MADIAGGLAELQAAGRTFSGDLIAGMQDLRQKEKFAMEKRSARVDALQATLPMLKGDPEGFGSAIREIGENLSIDLSNVAGKEEELLKDLDAFDKIAAKSNNNPAVIEQGRNILAGRYGGARIAAERPGLEKEIQVGRVGLEPKQEAAFRLTGDLPTPPKSILEKAGDLTKFTKESLQRAEKSGLLSDLDVRPETLQKGLSGKSVFEIEKDLRREFVNLSKPFVGVRDSFARVQASAKDPSAAGDLALIFNYMKILDPGSVVRESEFATAQNAAGVPERIRAQYNRVISGEKLSALTRDDFVDRAGKLFERQERQHTKREKVFTGLATRNKANAENIVIDLTSPELAEEVSLPEGITEEDIAETMRVNNMTRQQVIDKLGGR